MNLEEFNKLHPKVTRRILCCSVCSFDTDFPKEMADHVKNAKHDYALTNTSR